MPDGKTQICNGVHVFHQWDEWVSVTHRSLLTNPVHRDEFENSAPPREQSKEDLPAIMSVLVMPDTLSDKARKMFECAMAPDADRASTAAKHRSHLLFFTAVPAERPVDERTTEIRDQTPHRVDRANGTASAVNAGQFAVDGAGGLSPVRSGA
ncbi:hypothetical protein [Sphingomonas mucosissima]|uniref:hypothetical protein n=1 Tax=Sphingomonas mucosissima TaxID=370959 RepID=UPI0011251937|nr:hypothetical protein [Sphingomonas mucosissima]